MSELERKRFLASVGTAIAVAIAMGCGDNGPASPSVVNGNDVVSNTNVLAEAFFASEVPAKDRSRFSLRGVNGRVDIRGEDGSSAVRIGALRRVRSESSSDAQANLERLEVRVSESSEEVVVETIQPEQSGGRSFEVDYTIALPAHLEIAVVNTNGGITIEGITGPVAVDNANGEVVLREASGGAVVDNINGRIEGTVSVPRGGRVELSLANGDIELAIPRNTSAELSARTTNGTITLSDLPVANQTSTPTSLRATLGGGDGTITLTTVNGGIQVRGL